MHGAFDNRGMASSATVVSSTASIEAHIAPLRARLASHPLYRSIRTEAHLRIFMQAHVFAVWDFMSLLKALQAGLTCVSIPWMPTPMPESRRFINEIVLGEESDYFQGRAISHCELYLEAMEQSGADTKQFYSFLSELSSHSLAGTIAKLPTGPRAFVRHTFDTIESGSLHRMAAAFTFGREDLIPDIFRSLVDELSTQNAGRFDTFAWYLQRHIEIDGEDHGPLSLRMVADLCGSDEQLWQEATAAAQAALEARLSLWDAILHELLMCQDRAKRSSSN